MVAQVGPGGIGQQCKILQFPASRRTRKSCNGGDMTTDTIFKEFVEGRGVNFCMLAYGSRKYRDSSTHSTG